jgi:capsular exopolysaccharide synthesis family protein
MSTVDSIQPIVPAASWPPAPQAGYAPPGAGGVTGGITPADVWRVIKQRKVLIAVTFSTLYVLVVAGTLLIRRYWPLYSSEAYLRMVAPPQEKWGRGELIMPKEYILHELQTESAQIKSPKTLLSLLAQPEIKNTRFYRSYGDEDFMECLFDLQGMLGVAPVRDSYLIRVQLALPQREEATLVVNTLVNRYLAELTKDTTDESGYRIADLKKTQGVIQAEFDARSKSISDLRARRDMPAMEAERTVLTGMIEVLSTTKTELMARQADVEAQLSVVTDPRRLPLSAEMRLLIESDPVLRYYEQQVEVLDIQIEVNQTNRLGPKHPYVLSLITEREGALQKAAARREELIDDLRSRQVETLKQEAARVGNMLGVVQEQLSERESALSDLDAAIQRFEGLVKEQERLEKELDEVAGAVRESQHQLDAQRRESRLVPAGEARNAVAPSRPSYRIYLGGGMVLALLAALGLAFVREFTDQALRTPLDIARYGHISVLGCVPLLDDEEADIEDVALATRRAPQSLVAEAFRQIRAHLMFSGPLESQRTLLVTSPRPEDGKTAVAINLAVAFAQGNQRVLLVDCNFRRPDIRTAFKNAHSDGLSNVLADRGPFAEVVCHTEVPNLDVLTSGPMPPNPAELLGSALMRELIASARKSYDRIILDGPPCLLISDALVLAMQADAVVLVARAGSSSKGALRRAREQLGKINARVIGAVLNGVQARPGGYFRQQYREFYDYTSEEVVPRELPPAPPEIEAPGPTDEG